MNLKKIISTISSFSEEDTIFAEKIRGKFTPESEAEVIEMSDEELKQKTSDIAKKKCPGKSYFLEVFIVKEFIEDFANKGKEIPIEKLVEYIIYYAENDSYPEGLWEFIKG